MVSTGKDYSFLLFGKVCARVIKVFSIKVFIAPVLITHWEEHYKKIYLVKKSFTWETL